MKTAYDAIIVTAVARLALAKEVDEFTFEDTSVNETLVRDLVSGDFLDQQRNDRVDRWNRQVASRGKCRTILHQTGQEGSVFQHGRPREQA
jgi:hypothetical protein